MQAAKLLQDKTEGTGLEPVSAFRRGGFQLGLALPDPQFNTPEASRGAAAAQALGAFRWLPRVPGSEDVSGVPGDQRSLMNTRTCPFFAIRSSAGSTVGQMPRGPNDRNQTIASSSVMASR